ncbi:MAG TPA: glycosyltransferase [Phycisphaerae bacterium]|nr:glycosyltransferase [Phycisphaerae bacterium]
MSPADSGAGWSSRDESGLRVLYVITDLEVGGVPLHLLRLATALHGRGWPVGVVSLKPPGPVGVRLLEAGVALFTCHAEQPWDLRVFERLAGHIADFAPDVVHSLLFHANVAARVAGLLGGFPRRRLIGEIQTVEIERTWHLRVDRWTYRLSRLTIGNSQSVVDHLHTAAGIPRDRLRCVPGGVDIARVAAAEPVARDALGVGAGTAVLLWVGRMDPVKGLDTLLAAVDRLRQERSVCLLLAGDGPERGRVERDIARRGLHGCVRLLGRRDDVPGLLRSADIFVFPSRTEGFPNAVLEAMAAGLPVVATNVAGCRDLVTDRSTGLLVPADDPAALAGAVDALLADPALAATLAQRAQEMVARDYTLEACHERYADIYREVTG